jgi:hypothetical protein
LRPALLDRSPPLMVPLVRCPAHCQTRDSGRMAPRRLSTVLALAVRIARWAAARGPRTPRLSRAPRERESLLRSAQDPRRIAKAGFSISERTVARYLRRSALPEDSGQTWGAFRYTPPALPRGVPD